MVSNRKDGVSVMRTPQGSIPIDIPIALERLSGLARYSALDYPERRDRALKSLAEVARLAAELYRQAYESCAKDLKREGGAPLPPPERMPGEEL